MARRKLEDLEIAPPSRPIVWVITHRDGRVSHVQAQTAFGAAKRLGWLLSDCVRITRAGEP